jgi:ubiquinone/menaquinone biosynthesis C-methylase UbiE
MNELQHFNIEGQYKSFEYDCVERYISYYYQVKFINDTQPKNILEIGIGNGTLIALLQNHGFNVTTCDFDKKLNPHVVADITNLPFEDNEFDLVASFQVLEHIPFESTLKALKELYRVSLKM